MLIQIYLSLCQGSFSPCRGDRLNTQAVPVMTLARYPWFQGAFLRRFLRLIVSFTWVSRLRAVCLMMVMLAGTQADEIIAKDHIEHPVQPGLDPQCPRMMRAKLSTSSRIKQR